MMEVHWKENMVNFGLSSTAVPFSVWLNMKALRTDTMFVSILAASIYIIKVRGGIEMALGLNFKLTKL